MVGHHIEISNRLLHALEATITIAKQCKAEPCHKSPFVKGGFRGNVNVSRSRPTPANENRRNIAVSPVVVGHHIEISNRFLHDLDRINLFIKWLKNRGL